MVFYARPIATGSFLPEKIVTNDDLAKNIDTSDEWIKARTGIEKRHVVGENEQTSDLAIQAAKNAIEKANIDPETIDLLVLATTTPDRTFPATAVKVQHAIGMNQGAAFDVQAVCSGFLYGLRLIQQSIAMGHAKRALLIGADALSKIVDWQDRSTCILFGDGAGCVLFDATEEKTGILATHIASDGAYEDILHVDGGVGLTQSAGVIHMQGKEVFRHATRMMVESTHKVLDESGLKTHDINYLVPHQANSRIISYVAEKLDVSAEKSVLEVKNHGNTSAASIPLALDTLALKVGDIIATPAVGGGLTWGSAIIRW